MYYVYEWFIVKTGEIIYVGKGTGKRYKVRKHNRLFNEMLKRFYCYSRIVKVFDSEKEAFEYEYEYINELKAKGQCVCNIMVGGNGGSTEWWSDDVRNKYSERNVMKSVAQRQRMSENNPMKNKEIAKKTNACKRKAVFIGEVGYPSITIASKALSVSAHTIIQWCKNGINAQGQICKYANEKDDVVVSKKEAIPVIVNGVLYKSTNEASKKLGISRTVIDKYLRGKGKNDKYICEYGNQQPSRENSDNSIPEGSTTNR